MEQFVDMNFEHHRAIGLVWFNVALQLVTTPLVPFNVTDYKVFMEQSNGEFAQSNEKTLLEQNISLGMNIVTVNMFCIVMFDLIIWDY